MDPINYKTIKKAIFGRKKFKDKYRYLGDISERVENEINLRSLIIAIDQEAKPKWCPRWILRLLFLIACGNTVTTVRYRKLYHFFRFLTGGTFLRKSSYKFDGTGDLIIVEGPVYLKTMAEAIEYKIRNTQLR